MTLRDILVRALLATALLAALPALAQKEPERTGGPYVPTPQVVVDQMLRIGAVGAADYVIDLGSGDGVIVLTAARQLKARGMGIEIDPALVKLSNAEAKRLGVADRAQFFVQDVFKADLSRATVVTLYLLPGMMINLRPKIFNELRPGTRVVSHDYNFDTWQPDDSYTWDVPEKEKINGVPSATVHLWIVPAKVGGRWRVEVEGGEPFEATLRQNFQALEGTAMVGGSAVRFSQVTLRGEEVNFTLPAGAARQAFRGRAQGDTLSGTVDLGGGRSAKWTAKRVGA
jgi:Methyltransferase domain